MLHTTPLSRMFSRISMILEVFLLLACRSGSVAEERARFWLDEVRFEDGDDATFWKVTGLSPANLVRCEERTGPRGVGAAAARLQLTHLIDDDLPSLAAAFADAAGNARSTLAPQASLIHFRTDGASAEPPPYLDGDRRYLALAPLYAGVGNWDQVRALFP